MPSTRKFIIYGNDPLAFIPLAEITEKMIEADIDEKCCNDGTRPSLYDFCLIKLPDLSFPCSAILHHAAAMPPFYVGQPGAVGPFYKQDSSSCGFHITEIYANYDDDPMQIKHEIKFYTYQELVAKGALICSLIPNHLR